LEVFVEESDALGDQVLALFAADALMFPTDYECGVDVCPTCGSLSFGETFASGCDCDEDRGARAWQQRP